MQRIADNMEQYLFENQQLTDINPIFFGREPCLPNKSFGPTIRPYTLIHYVAKGKGRVIKTHGEFSVSAGKAFLIHPGEVVTYVADKDDPWYYYWVAFDGRLAERFRELDDVVDMPDDLFEEIYQSGMKDMCEYRVAALLYEMYVELFSEPTVRRDYVKQVKDYIKALYMQDITVERIAENLNLDRRYLSRIFKQKTGNTVQDYIIKQRMLAAQKYLLQGFSVEETAILSGYADPCNFSKMFKRRTGISPAQWKKQNQSY